MGGFPATMNDDWHLIGQATLNVTNGDKAAVTTALTTVNAAVITDQVDWPTSLYTLPDVERNACRMRFIGTRAGAADTYGFTARLFGFDIKGAGMRLFDVDVECGTCYPDYSPVDGAAWTATRYGYGHKITLTNDLADTDQVGISDNNSFIELRFDLVGMKHMWCDFDTDAFSGANKCTDGICIAKFL